MSDRLYPLPLEDLTAWIFDELDHSGSIFGIPRAAFFAPPTNGRLQTREYGKLLNNPFGVAAGPHSQMTQNIIVAWLCGARFIELKTVQTLDELEISKPCIDMEDEGYNVEWSQELRVKQSYHEYVSAWVLIHALHRRLGFEGDGPGMIFNASVGYDLAGIQKPNMRWFLGKLLDGAQERDACIDVVARRFPEVHDVEIPKVLSDNVTLSTMHGCPPNEIEAISRHLIEDWHFHTSVKLNPTLLGPAHVRSILAGLGYADVEVPDEAFGHDLVYDDAVPMLTRLLQLGSDEVRAFGVKLSNTLEVKNHRPVFAEAEKMMYLSGRPLHALTVNLAAKLEAEFEGRLPMSFAGGADAFNVASLLACRMRTVTVCSDLLKSGGYLRLLQYVDNTLAAMDEVGATSLDDFVVKSEQGGDAAKNTGDLRRAAASNLATYAKATRDDVMLTKGRVDTFKSKTARTLGPFDCVEAPCTDECPIDQDVPAYMRAVREGRYADAVAITREDNPLPTILGRICDRKCQDTCIRTHYDDPLAIRDMKRFIMAQELTPLTPDRKPGCKSTVGIIGAGPCGATVASELASAGYGCTIFEQFDKPGGMVSGTIPSYRLPQAALDQDLSVLERLGVEVRYGQKAGTDFTIAELRDTFDYVVISTGAQVGKRLRLEGEDADGVVDAIEFLRRVRDGESVELGKRIGVAGAGDVAMDAARTAFRLGDGEVKVIYRRTIDQMPADPEEVAGLLEEGIPVEELVAPKALIVEDGKLRGVVCQCMELGPAGADGRRRPRPIEGQEKTFELDTLMLAVSQASILDFLEATTPELIRRGAVQADPTTMETSLPRVFTGGDTALEGPSSAVKAVADGKRIARSIRQQVEGLEEKTKTLEAPALHALIVRRGRRELRQHAPHLPVNDRKHFEEVAGTLSAEAAAKEAARCLDCDQVCSLCVSVCPNLAFVTYLGSPFATTLPKLGIDGRSFVTKPGSRFRVDQTPQVAVLADFCNECGNCATFCPTSGRPYVDKPRLYFDRAEFEAQTDNAFMCLRPGGVPTMQGRFAGQTHELTFTGDEVHYRTPALHARFTREGLDLIEAKPIDGVAVGEPPSLEPAAVMFALLDGVTTSMPYWPMPAEGPRAE